MGQHFVESHEPINAAFSFIKGWKVKRGGVIIFVSDSGNQVYMDMDTFKELNFERVD